MVRRSFWSRFCRLASGGLVFGLLLAACDDGSSASQGDAGNALPGASDASSDAGAHDAASSAADGSAPFDAGTSRDASTPPETDASREAGAADATASNDARTNDPIDASSEAGTNGLRAQICGSSDSWPAPLPPMGDQRKAQPVGTNTFGFLEGPVWLADQGVLLFSDMDFGTSNNPTGPNARIRRLKPPATFDVFAETANSNGLALKDGMVIAATHDTQSLSLFDAKTAVRTKLDVLSEGKHFNSPNDLTVRSDGMVFFTDPDWQLGPRKSETGRMGVYRVGPSLASSGSNAAQLVEGTLDKPNGVALSPDERTLYVGSSANEVWKYTVAADGSVSNRTKFADVGGSDGMAIDCAGNLYVTSGVVEVFAPSGMKLGEISVDGSPSNAAFGGDDRKTLYITAGAKLYSIKLNVPGFPY